MEDILFQAGSGMAMGDWALLLVFCVPRDLLTNLGLFCLLIGLSLAVGAVLLTGAKRAFGPRRKT